MSLAGIFADQNTVRAALRHEGWDIEFHKDPIHDRFDWTVRNENGDRVSGRLTGQDFLKPVYEILRDIRQAITHELLAEAALNQKENPVADRTSVGATEIENRFGFHKATIEGDNATLPVHRDVRILFREFAEKLDALLVPGRAKSVAFTELENASMWSHKAIAEQAPVVPE